MLGDGWERVTRGGVLLAGGRRAGGRAGGEREGGVGDLVREGIGYIAAEMSLIGRDFMGWAREVG